MAANRHGWAEFKIKSFEKLAVKKKVFGFVGECQQSTVNPGELHFTAQWMPSVQSREWAYWARSWAKIKLYQDTGYYVLGIDVHREIPREKNSRFCMTMNNIPNCNCVLLVAQTCSQVFSYNNIFAKIYFDQNICLYSHTEGKMEIGTCMAFSRKCRDKTFQDSAQRQEQVPTWAVCIGVKSSRSVFFLEPNFFFCMR